VNASHLIAWLVCLGLAFFASAMALLNRGETIRIEKSMEEMRKECETAAVQAAVLEDIRALLQQMNERAEAAPWRTRNARPATSNEWRRTPPPTEPETEESPPVTAE